MKALEILKDCSKEGFLRYTRYELDEAIAELEALQSRSCSTCDAYDEKTGHCKEDVRITNVRGVPATFYCKWYEAKEQL